MKIPATIQQKRKDGKLECKGAGYCILYATAPKVKGVGEPYVSINMGDFRIHLDSVEFMKFCKKFLYSRRDDGYLNF